MEGFVIYAYKTKSNLTILLMAKEVNQPNALSTQRYQHHSDEIAI
jgi:hypothetical protein